MNRCSRHDCRTSLDDYPVTCPHGLPFCEHCTWEEACGECSQAAWERQIDEALTESIALAEAARARHPDGPHVQRQIPRPLGPTRETPPDLNVGTVLYSLSDARHLCRRCGQSIHVGDPSVSHFPVKPSIIADYYHEGCAQ